MVLLRMKIMHMRPKAEYTLNTKNYPTKIIYKSPDHITGQYEESGAYDTIEYNK